MSLAQTLARGWKRAFLVFFLLFSGIAFWVMHYPSYEAEATLLVNLKKGPTTIESNLLDPTQVLGLVRSHSHLLQGDLMLKKVVEELRLDGVEGKPGKIQETTRLLRSKYLVISSPPFTNLIDVRVRHKRPELAADIANTLVRNYLAWNVQFEHEEVDRLAEYLEKETDEIKKRLMQAEVDLSFFKTENHIADLSEEIKAYFQILPERFKSHYQVIQAEEIKLLELGVERSRLKELYTDHSPQIQYLDDTIRQVKEGLQQKMRQADLDTDFLNDLRSIPEKEMTMARMMREIKTQESLYTFLVEETAKARLLKAKETLETVRVVSWAEIPTKPSGRLFKLLAGALFAGFMALVFAVAWDETR